jgi:hypothetical protein
MKRKYKKLNEASESKVQGGFDINAMIANARKDPNIMNAAYDYENGINAVTQDPQGAAASQASPDLSGLVSDQIPKRTGWDPNKANDGIDPLAIADGI